NMEKTEGMLDDEDDGGFELGDEVIESEPESSPTLVSQTPPTPPTPPKKPTLDKSIPVLRWTLKAEYNQLNIKKMQAILILSEGTTPLRVIDIRDKMIISEEEGIIVDRPKFLLLAEMFGLG